MSMSVPEAAAVLGRSPQQVRKMAASGALRGHRVGKSWVLEKQSVAEAASQVRHSGRPLSPARAWGALDILAGGDARWLSPSARYQVRTILKSPRLENHSVWSAVFAAAWSQREMSCHPGVIDALRKDPRGIEMGAAVASRYGLDLLGGRTPAGLVVGQNDLSQLCDDYLLEAAQSSDAIAVVVYVPAWDDAIRLLRNDAHVIQLVVAQGLLKSPDPRARIAGQAAFASARQRLIRTS